MSDAIKDTSCGLSETEPRPAVTAVTADLGVTLRKVYASGRGCVEEDPCVIARGETLLGRAEACADYAQRLPIHDVRASRRHALLLLGDRAASLCVRDLGSRHGTFVNGQPLGQAPVPLGDGDVLRIGHSFFVARHQIVTESGPAVPKMLGVSPPIARVRQRVRELASSNARVLLEAESGTGKEVTAIAIHQLSSRRAGPLVAVNCAAVPLETAESQLFGHTAGAFTGAVKEHRGFFLQAHKGTLFLDELGEMPLALQAKVLRAVDTGMVRMVGGSKDEPCDVRLICATNRRLLDDVRKGLFRGDIYHRLAEEPVWLPPLRERREDILYLLRRVRAERAPGADAMAPTWCPDLDPELVAALLGHPWSYNVRELFNIATMLRNRSADQTRLTLALVQERLDELARVAPSNAPAATPEPSSSRPPRRRKVSAEELDSVLCKHEGDLMEVARTLALSRTQVYRLLNEYFSTEYEAPITPGRYSNDAQRRWLLQRYKRI